MSRCSGWWGDGVTLVDVARGYVVEAVEEGRRYPVDAADADVAFRVAAGCGVCVAAMSLPVVSLTVAWLMTMMRSAPSPAGRVVPRRPRGYGVGDGAEDDVVEWESTPRAVA